MSKNPLYRYTLKCNTIGYDELLGAGSNMGTVRVSLADGYALLYDSGQDFSRFQLPSVVSGRGARRHQVYIFEGSDVLTAYMDLCSTSESLGSELRGDASVYPEYYASWDSGTGLLQLLGYSGGTGDFTLSATAGRLYKVTFDARQYHTDPSRLYQTYLYFSGSLIDTPTFPHSSSAYTTYTYYLPANTASPVLRFYKAAGYESHTTYITNISVKVINTPPAYRGIKLYNAPAGGSQNICGGFSSIAAGFNYLSLTNLTYKIIPLF